ncbi:MAG TPA: nodulation protein NfeD [Mariprofundaceae bacterium]|nr:nodulation protein NfeD [Mariprofundaceae bacterium]
MLLVMLGCWAWPGTGMAAPDGARQVTMLEVKGAISPAMADYVHRGLADAQKQGDAAVILRMDTPGGLSLSMRDIIHDILASSVPVITYVAPSGARAASAGTYIMYASQVAAMAPATNLGAATPVQIGGLPMPSSPSPGPAPAGGDGKQAASKGQQGGSAEERKVLNDAVAYIRGLADMHGRNADWAESAVRSAASLTSTEALKQHVIDLIADSVPELLDKVDGRQVRMASGMVTLHTAGATVVTVEPDWRTKLLAVITDPNIAYLLMLVGFYGLFFELWNPGYILPGVAGAICLLLALFAFQVLPVNYAGLALILLGIGFMVAEVFVQSFGALGIGGVIAFVIGSVMLFNATTPGYGISIALVLSLGILSALFFIGIATMALKARARPVVSGKEEMIGLDGEARGDFEPGAHGRYRGRVHAHGEDWQAESTVSVADGTTVRITAMDGLILTVQPKSPTEESAP